MSQSDYIQVSEILLKSVKKLNQEQYDKLLTGEAQFNFCELTPAVEVDEVEEYVLFLSENRTKAERIRRLTSKSVKKELLAKLCKHYNIEIKNSWTKSTLVEHILVVVDQLNAADESSELSEFGKLLKNATSAEEAFALFKRPEMKVTKAFLISLGDEFNVYLAKNLSVDEMKDRIVKSVVSFRIGSQIVRREGAREEW